MGMNGNTKSSGPDRAVDPEQLLDDMAKYVNSGRARIYRLMGIDNIEWEAEGSTVRDTDGREFMDFCAGYAVMNAGHRHPKILKAVRDQLDRMGLSTKTMLSQGEVQLARRLAKLTPGDLTRSFFCATGAEAVEVALKMARMYTGRSKIIATEGGFHGKTMGALSATGKGVYREPFQPLLPDFEHVPYGDSAAMEEAVDSDTAGVILEPIQGEAGAICPDDDYLSQVRTICDRADALLIFDEVQSGIGRTGRNFACEHYGVAPDMMTLAKGLGGGIMPVGACISRSEIFDVFDEHPWIHSSTTGGNPIACAAACAALEVLVEEDLAGQAERKGQMVMDRLQEMQRKYPDIIVEVRGKGLLVGVEFTNPAGGLTALTELFERGVLVIPSLMNWGVMRIAPPLTIDTDKLNEGLQIVDEVMRYTGQFLESV